MLEYLYIVIITNILLYIFVIIVMCLYTAEVVCRDDLHANILAI